MTTISKSLGVEAETARSRAAMLSLYGGVLVIGGKAVAYLLTDSTAVLSDALESIVNVATAVFLVYSIRLAATPADRNHPYGHGKIEFFFTCEVAVEVCASQTGLVCDLARECVGPVLFDCAERRFDDLFTT